jgi:hypothetical protein
VDLSVPAEEEPSIELTQMTIHEAVAPYGQAGETDEEDEEAEDGADEE